MEPSQIDTARLLVVIPAHNEGATVGDVVKAVVEQKIDVVVVDDASDDDTVVRAENAGAAVLRLHYSAGAWGAMQTGIRYAVDQGFHYVITLDADGQHDPAAIPVLLNTFRQGKSNVVVGACIERGGLGRRIAWQAFRIFGGFKIRDLTSGYRLYDSKALKAVASEDATLIDYQDVGVLLLLKEKDCTIDEVDIPMAQRGTGKSRIFSSWGRVFYYLLYSTLLCASKGRFSHAMSIFRKKPAQ